MEKEEDNVRQFIKKTLSKQEQHCKIFLQFSDHLEIISKIY